jgi:hypothetical protein
VPPDRSNEVKKIKPKDKLKKRSLLYSMAGIPSALTLPAPHSTAYSLWALHEKTNLQSQHPVSSHIHRSK